MTSIERVAGTQADASTTTSWGSVFALSLGVVALILGEMLPASLLTLMAPDLKITEGMAGQAVTATALTAVLSSLLTPTATRRLDRRPVLLMLTTLLVISNLLVGLAINYPMLLLGRVLLGLGLGGFWSMAAAVSVQLVPASMAPRALSIVYGGVSIGMVAAIPLGTYLGGLTGWRGIFLGTAALASIALIWQAQVLPPLRPSGRLRLGTLVTLLRCPQLGVGNLSALLVYGGHFAFYTYLRPFLEGVVGIRDRDIALVLLAYGLASLLGTAVASAMIRANLRLTLAAMPLVMAALASALFLLSGASQVLTVALVVCWGFVFGVVPVSWATWLTRIAPDEIESANGLRVAGIQLAIAAGAGVGGALLDVHGPRPPLLAAGAFTLLAALLILAKLQSSPADR